MEKDVSAAVRSSFHNQLKDFVTSTYIRYQSCICRPYLGDLKVLNHRLKDFFFFPVYFWMVSIGKLQIRIL